MSEATSITSGTLIAADKVNGTNVYNPAGDNLGSIDDIMIDKVINNGHAIKNCPNPRRRARGHL